MDNNSVEILIPGVFYECFLKAVENVTNQKHKVEIVTELQIHGNNFRFEVKPEYPVNLFFLGKAYTNEKEKL